MNPTRFDQFDRIYSENPKSKTKIVANGKYALCYFVRKMFSNQDGQSKETSRTHIVAARSIIGHHQTNSKDAPSHTANKERVWCLFVCVCALLATYFRTGRKAHVSKLNDVLIMHSRPLDVCAVTWNRFDAAATIAVAVQVAFCNGYRLRTRTCFHDRV